MHRGLRRLAATTSTACVSGILTLDDGATIAVEYVSTNYSDETIAMKGNHFASAYSQVRWSANSVATRNRVLRIMRDACDVIP